MTILSSQYPLREHQYPLREPRGSLREHQDPQVGLRSAIDEMLDWCGHFERGRDGRAVFAFAYAVMTDRLLLELPSAGMRDPDWVVTLAGVFSRRYLDAIHEYEQTGRTTGAWQDVFSVVRDWRTSVIEDLLFGMAAHIVQDLPLSLVEVGTFDASGHSHIDDFHAMNEILGHSIVPLRDAVLRRYGPRLGWLDRLAEGYVEVLTNYGLRMSRGMAWYNTDRLLDPASHDAAAVAIARSPAILMQEVLHPPAASVRRLVWVARRIVAMVGRRWPKSPPVLEAARRELRFTNLSMRNPSI